MGKPLNPLKTCKCKPNIGLIWWFYDEHSKNFLDSNDQTWRNWAQTPSNKILGIKMCSKLLETLIACIYWCINLEFMIECKDYLCLNKILTWKY